MKAASHTPALVNLLILIGPFLPCACSSNTHGMLSGAGGTGAGGAQATGGASSLGGSPWDGAGGDTASGTCGGTPELCLTYTSPTACQAVGCSWDATTPPLEFCDGTVWPCSKFTTSSSCAFAGCEWVPGSATDAGSGGFAGKGGVPGTGGATGPGGTDAGNDAKEAGAIAEVSTSIDGPGLDSATCDGSAMNGTWYRALDGLTMILAPDGCAITGTADTSYYRHVVTGTYDSAARTMIGKIKRTNIASGCTTIMATTWVLTDSTHFTMTITSTDGVCDLLRTYTEQTVFVRK